jgi:hypothetical protein
MFGDVVGFAIDASCPTMTLADSRTSVGTYSVFINNNTLCVWQSIFPKLYSVKHVSGFQPFLILNPKNIYRLQDLGRIVESARGGDGLPS